MPLLSRLALPAVVLAAGLTPVVPASAGATACIPQARVDASPDSSSSSLRCKGQDPPAEQRQPTTNKGGKSVKPACVWVPEPGYQPGAGQKADGNGGHWYRKFCSFGDYNTLADFEREMAGWDAMNMRQSNMMRRAGLETRWFTTPPPAPRRTPQQVMASIVDNLPIPKTFIAVNPVATKQVVSFPTWVWLTDDKGQYVPKRYDPDPKEIVLEGYRLKWQIVPQLTVTPGDGGTEQTCDGAGIQWSAAADGDPAACTVTYDRSGQYTLSAGVAWTVQWWLGGVRQDDVAGPTNTATRPVTVLEIQAVGRR
ncbi:MAG TPA: hypothetical protein VGD71_07150 [Kribbella sp.]